MNQLFTELRRRNIFRIAGVYIGVGWMWMQVVDVMGPALRLPNWINGFSAMILLIGFPLVLLVAWSFRWTPDGFKRTKIAAVSRRSSSRTGRALDIGVVSTLFLLTSLMIFQGFYGRFFDTGNAGLSSEATNTDETISSVGSKTLPAIILEKSIAVLPFANRSSNPDDAFFADGIHDDLLTQLSKLADMRVISRTSVMGFRNSDKKIPDIAKELGVATVMEGAVQRAGMRVRINVQLIDAITDAHLWAEIYDRDLTAENIFDIQSEITKAIAAALHAVLSPENEAALARVPTKSLEAYEAYLQARAMVRDITPVDSDLPKVLSLYDKAIAADPNFAAAYSGKTEALVQAHWLQYFPETDWLAMARETLDKAIELDPDSVETLLAQGYYFYWGFLNYDEAEKYISRALELASGNSQVWELKGYVARRSGQFELYIDALENARRLDPLSPIILYELVDGYMESGQFRKSAKIYKLLLQIRPRDADVLSDTASLWSSQGEIDRAWRTIMAPVDEPDGYYFASRVGIAIQTRDPQRIQTALDSWPVDLRNFPGYPETYALERAIGLLVTGKTEAFETAINQIAARLQASKDPYPAGWDSIAQYWPMLVPGLRRDLKGVIAAEQDYLQNAKPDSYRDSKLRYEFAAAFAMAGEPKKAFDYLDQNTDAIGPLDFPALALDFQFDGVRDHPRYLAMKTAYEDWQKEHGLPLNCKSIGDIDFECE